MIFVDGQFFWGIAFKLLLAGGRGVFTCSDYFSDVGPGAAFDVKADFLYVTKLFSDCCIFNSFFFHLRHFDSKYPSDG